MHQNGIGAELACSAMLQHAMPHHGLRNGEAQLRECSGHIRVTKTRDYLLQLHDQRVAGALSMGVSIALAM